MGPTGSKLAKQQDAVPSDEWNRMKNASYSKAVTIAFIDKASVKSTRTVTDRHPVDPDPKGTPSKKKSQRCNSQCGDWVRHGDDVTPEN